MTDLRAVIAKNICELRTEMHMTQIQLAEVLSYSDKAVSKWERAEALPDVTVLYRIAKYFGVTVDYLLEEEHKEDLQSATRLLRLRRRNKITVSIMATLLVWLVATLTFSVLIFIEGVIAPWLVYIYALPVSAVVVLVFNSIWGARKLNFIIVSILTWTLLLSVYLTVLLCTSYNLWVIFTVGVPFQIILFFVPGITIIKSKKDGGNGK